MAGFQSISKQTSKAEFELLQKSSPNSKCNLAGLPSRNAEFKGSFSAVKVDWRAPQTTVRGPDLEIIKV